MLLGLILLAGAVTVHSQASQQQPQSSTGSDSRRLSNLLHRTHGDLLVWSKEYEDRTVVTRQLLGTAVENTSAATDQTTATATRIPKECPSWLVKYAAFHKKERCRPDAKYLVHSAQHGTSGLGDRIRGMMFTTRLAVSLQRVVLFTWQNEPHEPDWVLPPSGFIDWRLAGIQGYQQPLQARLGKHHLGSEKFGRSNNPPDCSPSAEYPCFRTYQHRPEHTSTREWILKGGLQQFNDSQFITILTALTAETPCQGCPPLQFVQHQEGTDKHSITTADGRGGNDDSGNSIGNDAVCLFQYLFKSSDELQAAADQHLLHLYGPQALQPGFIYVGMHLRLGGMETEGILEKSKGSGQGGLTDLLGGMRCAANLGAQVGINTSKVPVLFITDNHRLRNFIMEGQLTQAVTPNLTPTHLARMKKDEALNKEAAMSTYIDLELLARSTCFVASASGFSNTAWLLGGGKPCVADLIQTAHAPFRQHNPCQLD